MIAGHRRWAAAAATAVAAAALTVMAGCSSPSPRHDTSSHALDSPSTAAQATPPTATSPSTSPSPSLTVITVPRPRPGLSQTHAVPSAHAVVFHARMTDLWAAIVSNRPAVALQSFFPLSAYQQVKAIGDPTADWHNRLVADFRLDIRAAHDFLGSGASRAHLVRVIVAAADSAWIVPGVCDNNVGYWHVPESRLVYRQHGQLRSIGIASLISWRGQWYVVHFGAVIRTTSGGVVDNPSAGTGTPGPPGGC